ncbi:DUF4828 domain-containing protein [Enterococcus ureilyticus]|uniref:DUF4828 domain-containing protein n=1 Tax=Enterococcus ureilyticus TaxID=1131292 RepID=A0A1E5HAF2_9ENTE|nr:DUF4828 domain-containing protein [Enterococcus ureilyticus]MBM7688928.1 hypothetical protein [Enterococcus ureilyticus]MBO0447511.1 DUF4828 domain-containing protein [Enterococcus ureilyticus]OEG21928.1 DUF4828 domain-containing protein [Enterococcus ureilyticus]
MKKHWSLFLGASLITGIAGSLFLKKKQEKPQADSIIPNLYKRYLGSWWFVNKQKAIQHTLKIENDLQMFVDGKKLSYMLVELTNKRLVAQDEYGYHLIVQCLNGKPASLYDEADDVTYVLEAVDSLNDPTEK